MIVWTMTVDFVLQLDQSIAMKQLAIAAHNQGMLRLSTLKCNIEIEAEHTIPSDFVSKSQESLRTGQWWSVTYRTAVISEESLV